jgi:hypothetical protein
MIWKILGILFSIVFAWGVRGGCLFLAEHFGTTIDPATQIKTVDWLTGAALAAAIGAVETFERVFWPPMKARIVAYVKAKWSKWFPPVMP